MILSDCVPLHVIVACFCVIPIFILVYAHVSPYFELSIRMRGEREKKHHQQHVWVVANIFWMKIDRIVRP